MPSSVSLGAGLQEPSASAVPDGWKKCVLGDVAAFCGGGRLGLTKERDYSSSGYPAYSAAGPDGFVARWEFDRNAVVIPSIGSIGRAYRAEGRWTTLANTQIVFPDSRCLHHAFLHHRVDDTDYWPVSGTAQPFIKPSDLPKCWVLLPPEAEQRRIAAILDTLDDAIRRTEQVIAKLHVMKQGLLHDLLTRGVDEHGVLRPLPEDSPHLFKGSPLGEIPTGWESTTLGRSCRRITYGFTNPMPTVAEGPWMLTAADIDCGNVRYQSARHTTQRAFGLLTTKSRPSRGDILVTKDGTLGRVALLDADDVCVNQSVAVLQSPEPERANFLVDYLLSPQGQEAMLADAGGSTIKHIYITRLAEMVVPSPPAEEAYRISTAFSAHTNRIASEYQLHKKLRTLKQGLLHDLMTGKVRVPLPVEAAP